jgi:hypothetical protein
MKHSEITAKDCETVGFVERRSAIWLANELTKKNDRQYRIKKIDGLWFAYDAVKTTGAPLYWWKRDA